VEWKEAVPEPTPEEVQKIRLPFAALNEAINAKTSPDTPLLLAHYTSVDVAEKILRKEEIWFSNPLYMNDLEEMRTGVLLGAEIFPEFAKKASETDTGFQLLTHAYNHYLSVLSNDGVLDTYVFCLSELPSGNTDGLLSMWREYGSRGNGAALVFNTQKIKYYPYSPLFILKVEYKTRQERGQIIRAHLAKWVEITRQAKLADDRLYIAAYEAFAFVKALALVTKHTGFDIEHEWRVVYDIDRDPSKYFADSRSYLVGRHGIEPKLKIKFGQEYKPAGAGEPLSTGALSDILEFLILGPSVSSPLAQKSFIRMLEQTGKAQFRDRVFSSTIPLRPSL
jgi:hypothetical protein